MRIWTSDGSILDLDYESALLVPFIWQIIEDGAGENEPIELALEKSSMVTSAVEFMKHLKESPYKYPLPKPLPR